MDLIVALVVLVVALAVFGAVVGFTLKLVWIAIAGLVVGAIARVIIPGEQDMGLLSTALYGIGGSLIGGVCAHLFGVGGLLEYGMSILAATLLIGGSVKTLPRGEK